MRYLVLLSLLFLFSYNAKAQPISYRSNNQITVFDYNLFTGNSFRLPVYKDTLAANAAYTLDSCGKVIYTYTGNQLWYRICNPKRWAKIPSSAISIRAVDTIYRTPGKDSIYFKIDNSIYSIKDSTGGGLTDTAIDGANSRRWYLFNNYVVPISGAITLRNGSLPTNDPSIANNVRISRYDETGADMNPWFTALDNYLNTNPGKAYLQLTNSFDNYRFGVYQLGNVTFVSQFGLDYWVLNLTPTSTSAPAYNFLTDQTTTVSWVLFGADGAPAVGAIDSIYKTNDSVFAIKNSVPVFQYYDSVAVPNLNNVLNNGNIGYNNDIQLVNNGWPTRVKLFSDTDTLITTNAAGLRVSTTYSGENQEIRLLTNRDDDNSSLIFENNWSLLNINQSNNNSGQGSSSINSIAKSAVNYNYLYLTSSTTNKSSFIRLYAANGDSSKIDIIADSFRIYSALKVDGGTQVTDLAGTGNRMVIADSTGKLATQTIPSGGGGTVTSVATGYGLSGGTITTSGTLLVDTATLSLKYMKASDSAKYVPYVGAIADVDLGARKISTQSLQVTGTNGNGHINLRHQASDATATGQSTALFADANGDLKWKNDGDYYTTLRTQQTANRVYTFQNKSYTLGDSADIAARLLISDTATMLSPYLRKVDTASLSNRIDAKIGGIGTTGSIPKYTSSTAIGNATVDVDYLQQDMSLVAMQAMGSSIKGYNIGAPIPTALAAAFTMTSQQLFVAAIYVPKSVTLTGVRWFQVTNGSFTANNYNGVALYTVSGGTLTLVDSSTRDGNCWQQGTGWRNKDFVTPYSASAGIYYVAVLYSSSAQTTAPAIGTSGSTSGTYNGNATFDFTNSQRAGGTLASQTALPTSQALSGTSTNGHRIGVYLY